MIGHCSSVCKVGLQVVKEQDSLPRHTHTHTHTHTHYILCTYMNMTTAANTCTMATTPHNTTQHSTHTHTHTLHNYELCACVCDHTVSRTKGVKDDLLKGYENTTPAIAR